MGDSWGSGGYSIRDPGQRARRDTGTHKWPPGNVDGEAFLYMDKVGELA